VDKKLSEQENTVLDIKVMMANVMNRFEIDSKLFAFEKELQARVQKIIDKMEGRILLTVDCKATKDELEEKTSVKANHTEVNKTSSKVAQIEYQLQKFIESSSLG
jgi:hypothetical protein